MKTKKMKVLYSYRSTSGTYPNNTRSTTNPKISMEGKWLEALGFHIGDSILVSYEDGSIHISPAPQPSMVCESIDSYPAN